MIVDDFLPQEIFEELCDHARFADYDGLKNKLDGVVYPDICVPLPAATVLETQRGLERIHQGPVDIRVMFLRLSCNSTQGAPHQAHTDSIMGDYTFLLYLDNGPGGTSYVTHKATGMFEDPRDEAELDAWRRDTNVPEAWEITGMVESRANRANILPSQLMHRAEPVGGYGKDAQDGRIVLTAFFK